MAEINYYADIAMNSSDIQMNKNELQLPVIDNEATAPSSPVEGQMYFDTTAGDKTMYFYNGTAWIEMDGSGSGVATIVGGDGIDAVKAGTVVTLDSTASLSTSAGSFVDFTGSTLTAATGAIAITGDLSATGTPSGATFLRGDNVWATPAGSYTSWTLGATTGPDNEILDGDDVDIVGTSGIATSIATVGAKSTVTIDLSDTAVTPGSYTYASLTVDQQGRLTAASSGTAPVTYTLPVSAGGGNSAVVTLDASSGTDSTVTFNGTTNQIAISESTGNNGSITVGLPNNVVVAGDLTVSGGDITLGGTGRIQGIDTVSAGTDAASKAYVDALVTGGLTFKDGFNAGSGAIDGGGNLTTGATRVAISVGDYYVVTTSGSFYGSVSLDDGDSVICKQDAAVGTSDINDWVIVQSDEGVSQFSSGNSISASTGQAITSQTASVGSVSVQSFAYDGGTNVGHVPTGGSGTTFLRGDGNWVTPTNTGITSISATTNGGALGASNTLTVNGQLTLAWAGNTGSYVRGDGSLATFPTIPQGDITEVQSATATAQRGIKVTSPAGPIPVVGLDIIGQTNLASAPATDDELIIYDTSAATNKAVTIANLASAIQGNNGYATTITAWGGTTTHNLGTFDVNVQLYDNTTKETIYADIDRTTTNAIVVDGNGAVPTGGVRVLVSKIS
mgnify:FL=1|jgi:hypothetical protein|tara:strand:- start:429 stop:2453 length:2025 start_codon:yes stop_codon:yes gene_type:complete